MTSPLTLCADDFGQSEAIVQAILELPAGAASTPRPSWSTAPSTAAPRPGAIEHVSVGSARHLR